MGNNCGKTDYVALLTCKDWKAVEKQDRKKVKKLNKWVRDYGFDGRLKVSNIKKLQEDIRKDCDYNAKKMLKKGLDDTYFWHDMAVRREQGDKRRVQKEKDVMWQRKEDDKIGPVWSRQPVVAAVAAQAGTAGATAPNTAPPPLPQPQPQAEQEKGSEGEESVGAEKGGGGSQRLYPELPTDSDNPPPPYKYKKINIKKELINKLLIIIK